MHSPSPYRLPQGSLILRSAAVGEPLAGAYEAFRDLLTGPEADLGLDETAVGASRPDVKKYMDFDQGRAKATSPALAELMCVLDELVDQASDRLKEIAPELEAPLRDLLDVERGPVLRMTWYPSGRAGLINHPHTDIDLVTLLPTATGSGLELEGADGWLPVDLARDEVLVLTGDMLRHFGGSEPNRHRVVSNGQERMSASLFVNARPELQTASGQRVGEIFEARLNAVRSDHRGGR